LPRRFRYDALADVPSGRGARGGREHPYGPPQGLPDRVLPRLFRHPRSQAAFPPELHPVHRAVGRGRYRLLAKRRRTEDRRWRRLAGDPRLRHGAPEGAGALRHRSRALSGLRLRHGHRAHRHAEIRHPRSAHLLRGRPALAEALRLPAAGRAEHDERADAMKITFSWLKDHLDTTADIATVADTLTMLGLEVESIEDRAKALAPFTVAFVKEAKKHPNADKLSVCLVDTGTETVQVVCGAPNARTGMKGVFAPAGSHIPGTNLDLKKGVIRGVESNGMLVSMREMGLGDEHDGIIELPADAPVGKPFAQMLGLDDPVIDVKMTPDRADCLGVHGIARDLAAAGRGRLRPPNIAAVKGSFDSPILWKRDLPPDQQKACPFVAGRYFRKVKNGPSPKWLQDRLTAIGLRPISALVDITNYVTFDLGRPLHVFDAKKLAGDLTMRMAREGEEILALDGRTYRLDTNMTVIADPRELHSIGGVMGGEHSGCTETTTEMFLEVALFDPIRTAQTGRKLGVESDARYRFERGLDPVSADWGAEVAARLVLEFCGGEASRVVSAGAMPHWQRELTLRPARVLSLGGVDLP